MRTSRKGGSPVALYLFSAPLRPIRAGRYFRERGWAVAYTCRSRAMSLWV